jgi:hypothetical protein
MDCFTRYPYAIPLRQKTATEVGEALISCVFSHTGMPFTVHSDNDSALTSKAMAHVWWTLGIHKTQIAYRNPEGNAPVERFMRYLNQTLTIMLPRYNQWPRILPLIMFAYRVLPHATTLYSPFFLQYGRDPLLPVNSTLQEPQDLVASTEPCVAYARNMVSIMKEVFTNVRRRQDLVSRKNAEVRDVNRQHIEYQEGDPVWYWDPKSVLGLTSDTRPDRQTALLERNVPSKWQFPWSGPHRITSRTGDKVYRIWHDFRQKHISVTVRDLKLYHPFIPLVLPDPILQRKLRVARRPRVPKVVPTPEAPDTTTPVHPSRLTRPDPFPFMGPEDHARLQTNDLCVVRLRDDEYQPIGIMRFLSRDHDQLIMQYLGCINLDYRAEVFVKHLFQNSWFQPSTQQIYYKMAKLHRSHIPVTNRFTNQEILVSDLIAFPFGLQGNFALPHNVRKVVQYCHEQVACSVEAEPAPDP